MKIELHLNAVPDFSIRTYDPHEDDVRSILMDACRAIGRTGKFVVSGFGQDVWPVDVETDLSVFLEQLPTGLRAVHEGLPAYIDFYEQGIERSVTLQPADGGKYVATCTSRTGWQPSPMVEEIARKELEEMLSAARDALVHTLAEMAPDLARHPWIRQWLESLPEKP